MARANALGRIVDMASKKNRSGKSNRRSPKPPPSRRGRLNARFASIGAWFAAHRWHAIVVGLLLLFFGSLVGGYWTAGWLEGRDGERLARETIEDMKRGPSPSSGAEPDAKYARIEDIPGLPRYTEVEPGKPRPTLEEKPRPRSKPEQVASMAISSDQAWRRNAVPFRDLNARPLVAIVIDDVGLDRPRSKRAWELPGPLTMSFLPYAKDLRDQARAARGRGHELMLHLPMEPTGRNDPGPGALLVSMTDTEIRQRTTAALDSFEGFAGIIDDMGVDRKRSAAISALPGPLTLSYLTYADDLAGQTKAARAHGHELMLHLPMEPINGKLDPGPNALTTGLSGAELERRIDWSLDRFSGYVGVNNHMGSRFTAFRPGMETVMRQLKPRGLMFLDSKTTKESVGEQVAQDQAVPAIVRHIFLDDDESIDAVRRRLAEAEAVARRQGFVVAIGHPHEATLQALSEWLPTVQGKGLALAPATAVLRKRNGWD